MQNENFVINQGKIVQTPLTKWQKIRRYVGMAALILGIAIGAMALATPKAHADMNSYLSRLANLGYTGPIWKWEVMGETICDMQGRYTTAQIAYAIVATTGSGIYTQDAYEIIGVANDELCYGAGNSIAI